jgi:hypothetical protein
LKMLELSDKGLRTADIAKALGIPYEAVKALRRNAASAIQEVHDKINSRIDKYPENSDGRGRSPTDGDYKTLGGNPKPASESIVEPYRGIVVEMWNAGHSYTKIHPAIAEKGFTGSKNAVYQYIWKLEYEDPCVLARKIRRNKPGTPWVDGFDKQEAQALPDLLLDKAPRNSVYKSILKEGKSARGKDNPPEGEAMPGGAVDFKYCAGSNENKVSDAEKPNKPTMAEPSPLEQGRLASINVANDGQPEDSAKMEGMADVSNNVGCGGKTALTKVKPKKPAMAKYSPLEQEYLDLMYGVDDEQPEDGAEPKEESKSEDAGQDKKKRSLKE